MNGLSKRLVSLTMATAMVFSLAAVPATDAEAASKYSIKQRTSVQATKYYDYAIKGVAKTQYAKVSVSGTAKSGVTVKNGSKVIKSTNKIKGTGKTLTLKVKANSSVVAKKYTLTTKIYNTKTNKKVKTLTVKDVKVNYSATSVKLDQTAVTLKAGETATLKATMAPEKTNSKIKSWTTSDANVATVNNGVVTAVAAGTATITVKTSSGKTATATVTVEGEKKAEAFTLTADATKADTITATLSREVAADATVTVMKEGRTTAVDGKATITGTTLEFKGTANFTNGTYTITVKEGELSSSASVTVQDEYVKDIVITSKQALTNAEAGTGSEANIVAGSEAYIYYDVLNQYGESLRQSTNIEWSFSATKKGSGFADKNTGRLTVTNGDHTKGALTPFTYGSTIYVTGVYTKTGASVQQAVTVGLAQALDSVEVAGFINVNEPTKIVDTIPVDFGKDTWVLAYKALDQDGNNITDSYPSTKGNTGKLAVVGDDVTLISDNPLIIKSDFKDNNTFTVNGELYNSVEIQPGQYVDKGGEVTITAISNKTGNKTTKVLTVGEGALLQSLTLKQPTKIVASNDQSVVIPFTAKDTKGNDVTAYETIVRSSNELNLSASEGKITIKENNDGTAAITWSDDKYATYGGVSLGGKSGESLEDCDGYDRTVSLTTVVVGGSSENMMLSVADTRVPTAIKSVKILGSEEDLVSAVDGYTVNFMTNDVTYLDQYGDVISTTDGKVNAKNFFSYTKDGSSTTYGKGANAAHYGVRVDAKAAGTYIDADPADITDATTTYSFDTKPGSAVNTGSLKYSIISKTSSDATYSNASKVKVATYNIIPVAKLSGLGFNTLDKQQLKTSMSAEANGADKLTDSTIKNRAVVVSSNNINDGSNVSVAGTYAGKTVTLPLSKWSQNTTDTFVEDAGFVLGVGSDSSASNAKEVQITSFTNGVSGNALYWNELYNANTAKFERRDASKKLHTVVYDVENGKSGVPAKIEVKANVALSDAPSIITSVQIDNNGILNPDDTVVDFEDMVVNKKTLKVVVKDQYGHTLKKGVDYVLSYKVDKYAENTGDLAHVVNSYGITGNNSSAAKVTMAEIKDAFNLTVIADAIGTTWGSGSDAKDITLGADTQAIIDSVSNATDKNFRKGKLNYDR